MFVHPEKSLLGATGKAVSGLLILLGLLFFIENAAEARAPRGLSDTKIRHVVERALKRFNTPGMAIGIVHNGKIRHLKGYGLRDIAGPEKVDAATLFRVASTTKAFTAAALAILVDEGKLDWDDPVTDHLPDFRMADPWVSREITLRDLLTHRSGLGIGAGDLMLWPEPAGFSTAEIVHNLRHLKPASSFRSEYAYDNLLYIVAGEVVAAVSGVPWEEFVQTRILDPLGMDCYSGVIPPDHLANIATPHGLMDEEIVPVPRNAIDGRVNVLGAAGGLVCNARGMVTWMTTQLQGGVGPNEQRIFSEQQRDEMWRSQTILQVTDSERERDNTHFKTYALAWRKTDVNGYEVISHTGTLSGMQAALTLVPELGLGVIVLNNGSNYGARSAVMQAIIKSYMGAPRHNWVKDYYQKQLEAMAVKVEEPQAARGSGQMIHPLESYIGRFRDPWFGHVEISENGNGLRFTSMKSVHLQGDMEPFEENTFIVRWDNRKLEVDAYVYFAKDFEDRIAVITMLPISEDADSSFDFPDLRFQRVE
jgi:CubicO group peptidase (beta-lactamase class C family)